MSLTTAIQALIDEIAAEVKCVATYPTRTAIHAYRAIAKGEGTVFSMAGELYLVHGAATGEGSITADLGVDGILPYGAYNPKHAGCSSALSDNSSRLTRLYNLNPFVVEYDDFYPITGNFPRLDIPHNGGGGWVVEGEQVTASNVFLNSKRDFFVNQATGSDTLNHGLTSEFPFKTMQRAVDPLRQGVPAFQQTINVAAGVHDQNYRPSSDFPRAAVLSMEGFGVGGPRTAQSGPDLVGNIVIKGAGEGVTIVKSNPANGYVRGMYFSSSHVSVQDLTVEAGVGGTTEALFVIHRDTYAHVRAVTLAGASLSKFGFLTEAGGQGEIIGCTSLGNTIYDFLNYAVCSIADPDEVGTIGSINSGGSLGMAVGLHVTGDVTASNGSKVSIAGVSDRPVRIDGTFTCTGADVAGAYLTVDGNTVVKYASFIVDAFHWSGYLDVYGQNAIARTNVGKSYVAPATKSTVTDPVRLFEGASWVPSTSADLLNSLGQRRGPRKEIYTVTPTANGGVLTIPYAGSVTVVKVSAVGAFRSGWTIATEPSGQFAGQSFGHGDVIKFIGGGYATQFLNTDDWKFPGAQIQISRNIPGSYSGFEATYDADGGYWLVTALGTKF